MLVITNAKGDYCSLPDDSRRAKWYSPRVTKRNRMGKTIIPFGVYPEKHELTTAAVFLKQGFDVEFIKPKRTKGAKNTDMRFNGVDWEAKSPLGNGKKTVEKQLQRAGKQSKNIIIDSRGTKLDDEYLEKELRKKYALVRSIKKLILIKKTGDTVEFNR